MPGLLLRTISAKESEVINDFEKAKDMLKYTSNQLVSDTFRFERFVATGIHYSYPQVCNYIHKGKIFIWVNGECYGTDKDLKTTLLNAYQENKLEETLANIDGYYSAIIYDEENQDVISITDRYGFKPMYMYHQNDVLVIASELKCLTGFSDIQLSIRNEAISCFIEVGHLLGDMTWYDEVTLQAPATYCTYNLNKNEYITSSYWSWSRIESSSDSFEQAVDHVYDHFGKAVKKRCHGGPCSLALSGGLDSRTILACAAELQHTYTFGMNGSEDVALAAKLSKEVNIDHLELRIENANWYQGRIEGIWKTDGMCSMMHMHASQFHKLLDNKRTIHLNGFAGDLVLGGSWLDEEDDRITMPNGEKHFGKFATYSEIDLSYLDLQKEDPYYIHNRVRRFTHAGITEATRLLPHRLPFFDNDLLEYVYSLPDAYRKNYRLYFAMYKNHLPQWASAIEYQKTGAPLFTKRELFYRAKNKLKRGLAKFNLGPSGRYTNYEAWFKEWLDSFRKVLLDDRALIRNYLDINVSLIFKEENIHPEKISRIFTLEVWLQQSINRRYLTTEEVFQK